MESRWPQQRTFVKEQPVHKQIYIGIRNSHKWTRYVVLSIALIVAPITGTLAASAISSSTLGAVVTADSSTPGAVVAADSSSNAGGANPDSSKWV